jgi:hypothetical protein
MTTETVTALRVWPGENANGVAHWQCIGRRENHSILKAYTWDALKASLWKEAATHKGAISVTWHRSSSSHFVHLMSVELPKPEGTHAA